MKNVHSPGDLIIDYRCETTLHVGSCIKINEDGVFVGKFDYIEDCPRIISFNESEPMIVVATITESTINKNVELIHFLVTPWGVGWDWHTRGAYTLLEEGENHVVLSR